ncbi:amidohydrolase [Streptomyces montanisoli]|uniref:Amidohydrolase family protein n=1 Tax=Streptomyces montanisoli TaxID=2798581 RepID=A0A940MKP1_9ACTN|nr:amidohydrolase family protein [Streptomyces montanisoli]MBP0461885.1 amidohydrolase family protein [Streptomyces montanisoli]
MAEIAAAAARGADHRIDLVVRDADVHTLDAGRPRASAFAVRGGRVVAVGSDWDIEALVQPGTRVVDAGGRTVMPGLVDVHTQLGPGGRAAVWELTLPPLSGVVEILGAVRDRASTLGRDEWVVGGVVVGPLFQAVGNRAMLAALDEAAEGRPVMLRDDSLRHRWVNSRALEALGVDDATPDPEGGRYVRDAAGHAVGLLLGAASAEAERAVERSAPDSHERDPLSARTAVAILNSVGVTATQDAATTARWLEVFAGLDRSDGLNGWVVGSLPAGDQDGPEPGGSLLDAAPAHRSPHVRPDFVRARLGDGPGPARSHARASGACDDGGCFAGDEAVLSGEELELLLEEAVTRGLHAKVHATRDGSVRRALDAVRVMRTRHGDGPVFHIAHPEFVCRDDVPRFRELGVVVDASPVQWFPDAANGGLTRQEGAGPGDRPWPLREFHEAGVAIAAGSDWPAAAALPNPWLGIETMVTRRNPDPTFPGDLAHDQALDLTTAVAAHTVVAAEALGLSHETGRLRPGLSADFIVLDRPLFDIPVDEIHATQVVQTWFAGRRVHAYDTWS